MEDEDDALLRELLPLPLPLTLAPFPLLLGPLPVPLLLALRPLLMLLRRSLALVLRSESRLTGRAAEGLRVAGPEDPLAPPLLAKEDPAGEAAEEGVAIAAICGV